ncbi:MAG: DUF932 domain-containing protein [Candidatus Brocadiia bacterium]
MGLGLRGPARGLRRVRSGFSPAGGSRRTRLRQAGWFQVACQNTLTLALNWGRTVRVTHTGNLGERLR